MTFSSIEIDFRVRLPKSRYRWIEDTNEWCMEVDEDPARTLPLLARENDPDALDEDRVIDYSSPRLYRDFLTLGNRVRGDKAAFLDAIQRFASRFGLLGDGVRLLQVNSERSWSMLSSGPVAEPLSFWRREIVAFYELDNLAVLLHDRDIDGLKMRIQRDPVEEEFRYVHQGKLWWTRKPIANKKRHPVRYERLEATRAFDRAWTHLSLDLNKRLAAPLLVRVPGDPKILATAHPRTLLDALYLQLYLKAANIKWKGHCKWCGAELPDDVTVRRDFCVGTQCKNQWNNRQRHIKLAQARADAAD